jgi:hypothetical protein
VGHQAGDDSNAMTVDVSRRRRTFELGAAVAVACSIIAAVIGWRLADRLECSAGYSGAWIPLIVGTLLLLPGVVAALVSRNLIRRIVMRTLVWVTVVCAFPLLVAWMYWLNEYSGCRD